MEIKVPFLKEEVGAGDVVKAVANKIRVKTCGGCQKRARTLNKILTFTPNSKTPRLPDPEPKP